MVFLVGAKANVLGHENMLGVSIDNITRWEKLITKKY